MSKLVQKALTPERQRSALRSEGDICAESGAGEGGVIP